MQQLDKSKVWQVLSYAMETLGARKLALRYIQRAIALNPEKLELHLQASRLFLKEGQVDRAALHCKKADIGVGPGGFLYLLDKAINGGYINQSEQGNYTENLNQVKNEMDSSDAASKFNNSGIFLLEQNRVSEAITCFEQALKFSRKNAVILINLGLAYSKNKDYAKALELLEQAQQMGCSTVELLISKGFNLFHLGKYEEAVICFELARQMVPNDSAVLGNLGSCYQCLGKYDEAVDCYKIAIGAAPDDATLYNNMALCLEKIDQNQLAIENYIKALELVSDDAVVITNYAACLAKTSRYQEAIELCNRALDIAPNNFETWGLKGNILMDIGKPKEAAKAYAIALGLAS